MDTTDKVLEIPAVEGLEFDDATHTYRIDGLVIPSVSAILGPLSKAKYAGIHRRSRSSGRHTLGRSGRARHTRSTKPAGRTGTPMPSYLRRLRTMR